MPDVIHNPDTDWCACEPGGESRCGYRLLADEVIDLFNPRDGEEAEVSILMDHLGIIHKYLMSLPCVCTPDVMDTDVWAEPCERCQALGMRAGTEELR